MFISSFFTFNFNFIYLLFFIFLYYLTICILLIIHNLLFTIHYIQKCSKYNILVYWMIENSFHFSLFLDYFTPPSPCSNIKIVLIKLKIILLTIISNYIHSWSWMSVDLKNSHSFQFISVLPIVVINFLL